MRFCPEYYEKIKKELEKNDFYFANLSPETRPEKTIQAVQAGENDPRVLKKIEVQEIIGLKNFNQI